MKVFRHKKAPQNRALFKNGDLWDGNRKQRAALVRSTRLQGCFFIKTALSCPDLFKTAPIIGLVLNCQNFISEAGFAQKNV